MKLFIFLSLLVGPFCLASEIPRSESAKNAELYFITPKNGEKVKNPVTVRFGLKNMGVAPAGVRKPMTGHHHLIIDKDLPPLDRPIPNDKNHQHFGGGQTETTVELEPGKHSLQLILGDHIHVPHKPVVKSKKITIYVEK